MRAVKRLRYVRLSAGRRAAIWGVFLLAAVMGLLCVAVLHMKPILTNLADGDVLMSHWCAEDGQYKTVATRIAL